MGSASICKFYEMVEYTDRFAYECECEIDYTAHTHTYPETGKIERMMKMSVLNIEDENHV